jgi:cell division protein FtsW
VTGPATTAIAGGQRTGHAVPSPRLRDAVLEPARALDRPLTSYYLVLGSTAMLVLLGLVMVLSASSVESYVLTKSSFTIFARQAMWVAVAVPLMWLASRLPVRFYRRTAYVGLVVAFVLLALVPVLGVEVSGNRNWLDLGGGMRMQPSELAKLALIIWGADLLARKRRLLDQWKHLLVPLVPVAMLVVGLVLLGNDLGTAMVIMAIVGALLFLVGAPLRLFALAALAGATVVGALVLTSPMRMKRLGNWLSPGQDYLDAGWQAVHGHYALATGGWWGLGLGASRQKWGALPEAHTDFIFAIIGEELGLIGTLTVLLVFVALAYGGFRIALRSSDLFVRLAAGGVTAWVMIQVVVNLGAVLGLLPIVGVSLPLVSYGGSSLVTLMLGLGMLLSFARSAPEAAAALRARPPLRRRLASLHARRTTRAGGR